jgi:hypothetical protein
MRIDQLNFPTEVEYDGIHAFGIGHESCVLKFIRIVREARLLEFAGRQRVSGKEIRLVTPFVPERHLNEMKTVLREVLAYPVFADCVVVVNDLGMMNYIHRIDETRRMCLGRGLIACFDYAPWGRHIYEHELPSVQKAVAQVSLYDDEKTALFRHYQVTEVETDLTDGSVESLRELQKEGFKVYIHRSSVLYGTQRSCYIRRRSSDQTCSGVECEQIEKIEPYQLWDSAGFFEVPPDTEFPTMYLRGNQICGRVYDTICDWADGTILRME